VCHVHAVKCFKRFMVCEDLIMIQEVGGCQLLKIWKQLQNVMNWWLETIK